MDPTEVPLRIGVLLFAGIEPLDFVGPAQVFWSLESARSFLPPMREVLVDLVAESMEPVRCGHGLVVNPTTDFGEAPPFDVVIVPGGTGGETDDGSALIGRRFQARHEPTLAFVRTQAAGGAVVASVCTGTFILAGAGLLAGRTGNTHWRAREELLRFMADRGETFTLRPDRVVDDGDILTAGGVSSGIDLALHLVDRLLGERCRAMVTTIIESETPPDPVLV